MIKKLRLKITFLLIGILSLVLIGTFTLVNLINYRSTYKEAETMIQFISQKEHRNIIDSENSGNELNEVRVSINGKKEDSEAIGRGYGSKYKYYNGQSYYRVEFGEGDQVVSTLNPGDSLSQTELLEIASMLQKEEKTTGRSENYIYKVINKDAVKQVYFMDYSMIFDGLQKNVIYSILVCCIGVVIFSFVSYWISKSLVQPVEKMFELQREFIADSEHELKTPLAIIKAGVSNLEHKYGHDKSIDYINQEVKKLQSLTNDMLTLTKVEKIAENPKFELFDLGNCVSGAFMAFESVMYEHGIQSKIQVESELMLRGMQDQIVRLATILLDNAAHHTKENGKIEVMLAKGKSGTDKKKAVLSVRNTGEEIPIEEQELIFERFYRSDRSRNRNQNRFGLGLSIAKKIVEMHHGDIKVNCQNGWTVFVVRIPI